MSAPTLGSLVQGEGIAELEKRFRWWRFAIPTMVMVLGITLCLVSPETNSGTQSGVSMELPDFISGYIGLDQEISFAERQILPDDTEFARKTYHNPQGDRILCSIVLAGGEKRSIHRPEVCLPGQGWTIRGGVVRSITLADGRKIEVMDLSLTREVEVGPGQTRSIDSHYFYFFVGKEVVTPYHWRRVFLTSWDRVTSGLNHRWAYVIVSSNVTKGLMRNGKSDEETIEMLTKFTADVTPHFLK